MLYEKLPIPVFACLILELASGSWQKWLDFFRSPKKYLTHYKSFKVTKLQLKLFVNWIFKQLLHYYHGHVDEHKLVLQVFWLNFSTIHFFEIYLEQFPFNPKISTCHCTPITPWSQLLDWEFDFSKSDFKTGWGK